MAPYGFQIVKSVTWRGEEEEFGNVYHYDLAGILSSYSSIVDAIVAIEKPAFGTNVTFKSARVWGPTDSGPEAAVTELVKDLSGLGTQAGTAVIPMEETLVVQWYLGRSPTTQRKRFLRKYLHICKASTTDQTTGGMGNTAISSNLTTLGTTYGDGVKNLTVGGQNIPICAWNGDHLPVGTTTQVLPYMHTRQFRR